MAGKKRRKNVSRSARAELRFPVSRIDRFLREGKYSRRVSSSAPVFLAGVLEYITSNILELAAEEACKNGKKRIGPEHVCRVVQNDDQLCQLFKDNAKSEAETPESDED